MVTTEVTVSPDELQASRAAERAPDPCVVVIFGASGDLTKRKLLPALYHLEQAGLLPENFAVVGVARRPYKASLSMTCGMGSSRAAASMPTIPSCASF